VIDIRPEHRAIVIAILSRIIPDAAVLAFGSRVTGSAKKSSDLDLAIKTETKIDKKKLQMLAAAFEESDLPYRVDLVDWNGISENFRTIIEKSVEVMIPGRAPGQKIIPPETTARGMTSYPGN
jgi:type I restriction enzyme S subunit